jgi:hypothetical protein
MRRMCRGAQTRYVNIRLRKSRVNSLFSARPSHQKAGHRAIAHVVPRAGVVNARRPGRRPGRSEAKSIDEAEHGASLKCAMSPAGSGSQRRRSFRETLGRARAHFLCDSSAASSPRIWTRTRARARRVRRARPVRADSDMRHEQRWRERPRLDALGHSQDRTPGSFTPSLVHRLRYRHRQ